MTSMEIMNLEELKILINKNDVGILFCFGASWISKAIQAKTRLNKKEKVPSHVAIIYKNFLYESTSQPAKLGNKTIPSGVRRYLLKDFFRLEKEKDTKYAFYPCEVDTNELEKYIHYPYGIDSIVDFLIKDESNGVSRGLICSQYGNKVTKIMDMDCPSPAVLYRFCNNKEELDDILQD
jgi:hypothetical protein